MKKITAINSRKEQQDNTAVNNEAEELHQVRELLFGQQSREFDRRNADLQGQLDERIREMNKNLEHQVSVINKKIEQLTASIRLESQERDVAITGLRKVSDGSIQMITDLASRHELGQKFLQDTISAESARIDERHVKFEQTTTKRHEEQSTALANNTRSERERIAKALRALASELTRIDSTNS